MKRSYEKEMMDLPDQPRELLEEDLHNLRIINRLLGNYRNVMRGLTRLIGTQKIDRFSLLDVGTGSGDIPTVIARLIESHLPLNPHLKTILNRSEPAGKLRSTYPVYFSPRRSYGDNVLLVGDAARVNEPVSGEGVYFALKSGLLAAETIDAAFRAGDFSATRLRAYEAACRTELRLRRGVNALIRALIYRPALASPLIRFSAKRRRLLDSLVRTVCLPDAAR